MFFFFFYQQKDLNDLLCWLFFAVLEIKPNCYLNSHAQTRTHKIKYSGTCPSVYCHDSSTEVKVVVESLPRSESSLLSVKLGGLFLRDLTTHDTVFPVLVSPKMVKK